MDAFNTRQRWYLNRRSIASPTLVSRSHDIPADSTLVPRSPARQPLFSPVPSAGEDSQHGSAMSLPEVERLPPLQIPQLAHFKTTRSRENSPTFMPLKHADEDGGPSAAGRCTATTFHASMARSSSFQHSVVADRYSASVSCVDGLRKSLETESIFDDDDDSVQLLTFDKVKVHSACSLNEAKLSSRKQSGIGVCTQARVPRRQQPCMHSHIYTAADHDAFVSYICQQNAGVRQAQRPLLISAEQLSASLAFTNNTATIATSSSSFSGSTSMSPCNITSVISQFPEPPSRILKCSRLSQGPGEDDYIEKWLKSTAQVKYHPALRGVGQNMPPISFVMSSTELVVPDKFRHPGTGIIAFSESKPNKRGVGRSIYGERGIIESESNTNLPVDYLMSELLNSAQSHYPGVLGSSAHAVWPLLSSAVCPIHCCGVGSVPNGVSVDVMVARLNHAIDISDVSSWDSSPDVADMAGLDEPLLESSDLCLRRATLVSYQKRASEESREYQQRQQPNGPSFVAERSTSSSLACCVSKDSEKCANSGGGCDTIDSRYFSAVSLPRTHDPAARCLDPCMEVDEDENGVYFDRGYNEAELDMGHLDTESDGDASGFSLSSRLSQANAGVNLDNLALQLSKILLTSPRSSRDAQEDAPHSESQRDSVSIGIHTPTLDAHYVEQEESAVASSAAIPQHGAPSSKGVDGRSERSSATLDEDVHVVVRVT
ncbi:hypothetical protein GQ54DRAFT_306067 [Martensiomyces pterosporus]|nr:hypothetical protein GQ54DRAFT_306067 [Martensiomyces pterosporus]